MKADIKAVPVPPMRFAGPSPVCAEVKRLLAETLLNLLSDGVQPGKNIRGVYVAVILHPRSKLNEKERAVAHTPENLPG
jgi:hypothetical protein